MPQAALHFRHPGERLRIADPAGVAEEYHASLSSAARQYIGVQDIPAALIVGYPCGAFGERGIRFKVAIGNDAFLREFGDELLGEGFEPTHAATTVLNQPGFTTSEVEIPVIDQRDEARTLVADTIFIRYCTLTLLHAVGRPLRTFGWRPFQRQK